jgi:hypothetical protein
MNATAKFRIGRIVCTPSAIGCIPSKEILTAIRRHQAGDWGEIADYQANDTALMRGHRLRSVYSSTDGSLFWVITEADRSSTTILLPSDY